VDPDGERIVGPTMFETKMDAGWMGASFHRDRRGRRPDHNNGSDMHGPAEHPGLEQHHVINDSLHVVTVSRVAGSLMAKSP